MKEILEEHLVKIDADLTAFEMPTYSDLLRALSLSHEALIHGEAKMKHYPEPVQRHNDAISASEIVLVRLGRLKKD